MRKFLLLFVCFAAFMLLIPCFVLMQGGMPAVEEPDVPKTISRQDYQKDNFYLIKDHKTGKVMTLTPNDYIKGVVAAEMPIFFEPEALKAQAVAAHTYALRQIGAAMAKNPSSQLKTPYLSTDPNHFQAYLSKDDMKKMWGKNFDANYQKLSKAVDSVINETITYQDEPILAAFHSISAGKTESAQTVWGQPVSYLVPVDSKGDLLSPGYESKKTISEKDLAALLKRQFPNWQQGKGVFLKVTGRTPSGTVTKVKAGNGEMTGIQLRTLLKLRSADFTVTCQKGQYVFLVKGNGHGVGMSQYGADYLARQGQSYRQILAHYYQNTKLTETA